MNSNPLVPKPSPFRIALLVGRDEEDMDRRARTVERIRDWCEYKGEAPRIIVRTYPCHCCGDLLIGPESEFQPCIIPYNKESAAAALYLASLVLEAMPQESK